jgi:hypothetical protein
MPSFWNSAEALTFAVHFQRLDAKRHASCLYRLETRSAHHAGDVVSGKRQAFLNGASHLTNVEGAVANNIFRGVKHFTVPH